MKNKSKQHASICACLIFFVFYLWLAAQIPYTHDDWDWGLDIGLQQLLTANINSRYAGNFLEVVMTRSALLKTILMGAGFFLIPYLVSTIALRSGLEKEQHRKTFYFLLCNVLVLLMDRQVWQQTYGWVAGFANFVASAVFLLLIIKEGLCVFDEIDPTANRFSIKCIVLLVIGIVGQLFLENVAIFLVLFSLAICVIYYKRTRALSKEYLFLTIGTIVGLAILFTSSVYPQLLQTGTAVGGYRQMHLSANTSIGDFIYSTVFQIGYVLLAMLNRNVFAYGCILLLLNIIILLKKHRTFWSIACFSVNSCLFVFLILYHVFSFVNIPLLISAINVGYILLVTDELIWLFLDSKLFMGKLLLIWMSTFAVIAPLIVTSETGARLFFTTHTLLTLLCVLLLSSIIATIPVKVQRYGVISCAVAAIILMAFFGNVYFEIGACMRQRNTIIAQAIESGADEITIPAYPHPDYLWVPNPQNDKRVKYFKEFYGISPEVNVIFE